MFCENCGKPNEDGARFCEHCGAAIAVEEAPVAAPAAPAAAEAPVATAAPAAPKVSLVDRIKQIHQKNKLILPGVVGVLVIAIVLTCVLTVLGKRVEMTDYLNVTVSGCEGYGQLDYEFDYYTFFMRLQGNKDAKAFGDFDESTLTDAELENLELQAMKYAELMESIDVTVTVPDGRTQRTLRNGDQVTIKVECNTAKAKGLDVEILTGEFVYEVKDLSQPQTFNILDYFDVAFEGYDGYGSCELVCTESIIKDLGSISVETNVDDTYFTIYYDEDDWSETWYVSLETDTWYGLSNGDTVKLTVEYLDEDDYVEHGVLLETLEKEITVSGLKEAQEADLLANFDFIFSGVNGYGELEAVEQSETLTIGDLEFDLENGYVYHNGDYVSYFYIDISDRYSLSNGDVVTVTLDYYADDLARYGVSLTNTTMELTVSGLTESQSVDLLANYDFVFSGLDGDGDLSVVGKSENVTVGDLVFDFVDGDVYYNGEYISYFYVNTSKSWGLTNGDVVTVTLSYNEDTLARYGVNVATASMDVTVAGLGTYATGLDPIKNSPSFANWTEQCKTIVMDYLYDNWNRAVHNTYSGSYTEQTIGDDMTLYKTILTTPKSSSSYDKNTLWLVFTVTLDDSSMEPTLYYFAVSIEDVAVMGDGTLETYSDVYYYRGYTDYQELYNNEIATDSFKLNIYE